MNNSEFYTSREDNYIGENKAFPAEIYRKVIEENKTGRETADYGQEVTTLQKKSGIKKNSKDTNAKKLADKIFGSLKNIVTTATVAVSAIAVTGTAIANAPSIELIDIDVGSSYVEYEIELEEVNGNCFVIISDSMEEYSEAELEGDGIYKSRVDGLMPEWEYTLSVVIRDDVLGDVTQFKQKFQTDKHTDSPPITETEPPDSYSGAYELPIIDVSKINWQSEKLEVPIVFENVNEKYYYKFIVFDINGEVISEMRGKDSGSVLVDIQDGIDVYAFTFEIYGVGTSDERLIERHTLGSYDIARPTFAVTDIRLAGENLVRVEFNSSNTESVSMHIEYQDGTGEDIALSESELLCGYLEVLVPDTSLSLSLTPIMAFDGYTVSGDTFVKEFTDNLEIDTVVSLNDSNMSIELYIKSITNGATALHLECSEFDYMNGEYYFWDGRASVSYTDRGEMSFTVYLTNEVGERLSNEVEISVDTTAPETTAPYIMNYKNPNDVGVTYNSDGTINVYVNTDFECEDESYYYTVTLGRYVVRTREKVAVFESLPNETYPIQYNVCFERDGQHYSVQTITPSGAVNEIYFNASCILNADTLTVSVSDVGKFDLNSFRLVSSDGEEIRLTEEDFTDDGYGNLSCDAVFSTASEYVTVYVMICPRAEAMEFIDEYKGSLYMLYETEIYPY